MAQKIIGVLGLGVFGQTIALELAKYGSEVIAIDRDAHCVQEVAEFVTNAIIGDFSDIDILRDIGMQNCDVAIIATGGNLESSVLAAMHLKKLQIPYIVGKAKSQTFEEVLYELGVNTVISPERDSGYRLASRILHHHIDEVLRLDDETSIIEFAIPHNWVQKTVIELDLRRKYDINLIGFRPERGENMTPIDIHSPLPSQGYLVGIAMSHTFERFDYLNLL